MAELWSAPSTPGVVMASKICLPSLAPLGWSAPGEHSHPAMPAVLITFPGSPVRLRCTRMSGITSLPRPTIISSGSAYRSLVPTNIMKRYSLLSTPSDRAKSRKLHICRVSNKVSTVVFTDFGTDEVNWVEPCFSLSIFGTVPQMAREVFESVVVPAWYSPKHRSLCQMFIRKASR